MVQWFTIIICLLIGFVAGRLFSMWLTFKKKLEEAGVKIV